MPSVGIRDTPVADTFPLLSLSTFLTSEFVERCPNIGAGCLSLQVVTFRGGQLGVRELLLSDRRPVSVTDHSADGPAE